MSDSVNVMVLCPSCGWKLFSKLSMASGKVEVKCTRCKKVVVVDLAFRLSKRRSSYIANNENRISL